MKISQKTFIITGGASGLGQATVRYLHQLNANVVIFDLSLESGQELVQELGNERVLFCETDITNENSVKSALEKTVEKFKQIHGVVNCAGIAVSIKTITNRGVFPLDVFSKVLSVNLIGTFNVIRLTADIINKQQSVDGEKGIFIMTASCAATEGQQGQTAYSASKAGIVGMTLPMAREFAPLEMRVMTISPGIFATPMVEALPEKAIKAIESSIPFPARLGKPAEFAQLVQTIIENPYLNGEVIRLDGGVRLAKL
ncbi:hypothetical protein CYY_002623 [Polysphondylium violaceum]|uniref:3-hydroxyacyl-CoA dehydrogenase n=1 Tax=Polysphondylium violaceum TaxID=133409 RepID=A0A8J4Q1C5_9MYCE|nr:hypothetical protein CYY_002623 [Polysphondylium violaceum]